MSTVNDTDLLLVERNGIKYQITYDQMSTLNDDDLLLVERGGVQYKVEAQDISTGANGLIIPPVEVLTPVNGAGITVFDQYEPVSSAITAVGEAGTITKNTDEIQSVTDEVSPRYSNNAILTGSLYPGAGDVDKMFDGTTATCGPTGGAYVTFTPSTPIPINSSLRIRANVSNTSVDADFAINGSGVSTVTTGFPGAGGIVNAASTWTTISSPPPSLTSLRFGWPSGGSWMALSGIEIDGVELIDETATGNKTLSFATNTNFSGLSVGDVVQNATFNKTHPTDYSGPDSSISADSLTISCTSNRYAEAISSIPASNYNNYSEFTVDSVSSNRYLGIAVGSSDTKIISGGGSYVTYREGGYVVKFPGNQTLTSSVASYTQGDVIGVAIDSTNVTFYKNGVPQGTYAHGLSGDYYATALVLNGNRAGQYTTITANFGATPFVHTPPTGYSALGAQITSIDASEPSQQTVYATWNPSESSNKTLTNGNLDAASTGGGIAKATQDLTSGKWYWEVTSTNGYTSIGLAESSIEPSSITWLGQNSASGVSYAYYSYNGSKYSNGSESSYGATYTTGDVIGIALDLDAGTLNFYKNGIDQGTAFTGLTGSYTPAFGNEQVGTSVSANFGETAFAYTPPTGYTGLSELVPTYPSVTVDGGTWDSSNQSQVWSSQATGGSLGSVDIAFNGEVPSLGSPPSAGNYSSPMTFEPTAFSTPGSVNSLVIYGARNAGSPRYIKVDGVIVPFTDNNTFQEITVNVTSFSSIVCEHNGTDGSAIAAIYVNGKLLVDAVNDSQVWSNSATNPSSQPSIAISNGFDGKTEIGDITYAAYTGGAFPAKNVSFAIAVQSTDTIRIKVQSDLGPFLVDTGNGTVSYAAGSGSYWLDISDAFTSNVTNWKIGSEYNWNFSGLEINGKILVDAGIRDFGDRYLGSSISYVKSLTFTDTTELANMVGPLEMTDANGDVVTPVSDTIANVSNNVLTLQGNTNIEYFQPGDEVQTGVEIVSVDTAAPSITVDGGEWLGADGTNSAKRISRSLRFNSSYLSRTPSSAGNRKTWTWSGWIKRSNGGASKHVFDTAGSPAFTGLYFEGNDRLDFRGYAGGYVWRLLSTQVFRDFGAWMHVVLQFNTTASTASDRAKVWVNGQQITAWDTASYPSQNYEGGVNNTTEHQIGGFFGSGHYDGYLADIYFVDGQALAPTDFGEFDDNNVWQPKAFSGTYGTNGFHLDFSNNSSDAALGINSAIADDYTPTVAALTTTNASDFYAVSGNPASNLFDGSTSTLVYGGFNSSSNNSDIVWTPNGSYSVSSSLRVYVGYYSTIYVNGVSKATGGEGSAEGWVTLSHTGSITSIKFENTSNANVVRAAAIEIDGTILTTTAWTVNNLSAPPSNTGLYASNFASSNGFDASYPARNAFDGSTSTYAQATTTGGTLTFTPPTGISYSSSIKIYMPSAGATASVNGGSATSVANSSETTIASGSGTLTSLVLTASNLPGLVYIKIDDQILVNPGLDTGTDSLVDVPANYGNDTGAGGEVRGNYCTLNPLKNQNQTLKNGNLECSGTSGRSTGTLYASSGKFYWEFTAGSDYTMAGIESSTSPQAAAYAGENDQQYALYGNAGSGLLYHNGVATSFDGFVSGDIIGVALDMDGGNLYFYRNGSAMNSGNAAATGLTGAWTANCRSGSGGYDGDTIFNFGQRPFAYAAPSGYKALCDTNLPSATIKDGSKYFDIVQWTGQGNANDRTITTSFNPDLVWIKSRSDGTYNHALFDTTRGFGTNNVLSSNTTGAEGATDQGYIKSTTSSSMTLGVSGGGNAYYNGNNFTYVAWAWNAGDNSNKTYNVTVVSDSGNKYRFDGHGTSAVTLDLEEGSTYTFDQSDSSNAGHPLRFSTTSNGTHGGGSEYTTGVVTNGTPGSAGAYTEITIAAGAPTLYYYCSVHSGMGGQLNTNSTAGATVLSGSLNDDVYDQSQTWSGLWTGTTGYGSFTNLHDADDDDFAQSLSATLTFPSAISLTSLRIQHSSTFGTATLSVNGTDVTSQLATSGTKPYSTITGFSSLTSIAVTGSDYQSNVHTLYNIEVNGRKLIDSGVSVTAVPSINSVVRANPAAGFSVVRFTGYTYYTDYTLGHGLNAAPEFIIARDSSLTSQWTVYHSSLTSGHNLYLNLASASDLRSSTNIFAGNPTSSVFTYRTNNGGTPHEGIAYCFSPVEGHSAMGIYSGNQNVSGPFVYTGFKVAMLWVKRTDVGADWFVWDKERGGDNFLCQNGSYAENVTQNGSRSFPVEILSNGFKIRTDGTNVNGPGTFAYIAWAENPFAQDAQTVTTGDTQVALDALVASATEIIETDGTTMYLNGATGPWRTGLSIEGSQINAAPPGPSEITFTSQNQGTPVFSGVDATLASRTWTLESSTTATGPWTQVDTYNDFGVLSTQTGATPWTENKPTLQPNTFYRIKVAYNSTNATSVESVYNTFKTGDA